MSPDQVPEPTQKPELPQKKVMLCVWCSIYGILHWEMLNDKQNVDSQLYVQQLDTVKTAITRDWPALVNKKGILFLHDNATPHVSKITGK